MGAGELASRTFQPGCQHSNGMVDDLLCISECGHKTSMLNSFINHKTNRKKLQFGVDKCKKLHIGKNREDYKCKDLFVDGWKLKTVTNVATGENAIKETYEGPENIETTDSEKYLGDIISSDGKNTKNIINRQNKGHAASTQVLQILENIFFGKYYFQAAVVLRNSLLVSSMLFNSEAWYNVTNAEIKSLEKIDETCIRKILNAPYATPKIMLYLELGVLPLRYIMKSRRLNYLHYILNEDEKSLIHQFLRIQIENPTQKDWGSQVRKDMEELDIGTTMEDIKSMPKTTLKKLVKTKVNENALKYLISKKKSKTKEVLHENLIMQEYLEANDDVLSIAEKKFLFQCRSRMLELKCNMKNDNFKDLKCSACGREEESQMHLMQCEKLNHDNTEEAHDIKYSDLFSDDIIK